MKTVQLVRQFLYTRSYVVDLKYLQNDINICNLKKIHTDHRKAGGTCSFIIFYKITSIWDISRHYESFAARRGGGGVLWLLQHPPLESKGTHLKRSTQFLKFNFYVAFILRFVEMFGKR